MIRVRSLNPAELVTAEDSKMIELYYYENSVCAERVLMTLSEKRIDDWIPHHLRLFKGEHFSPAYLQLNPKGVVPTLVHDGNVIRESAIICDYVDELSTARPLKPTHPADRARMREWIKDSDDYIFEAVGSLSFASVFRARMLQMSPEQRSAHWRNQRILDRALRQVSCVEQGLDSPYAIRAIASWDRTWKYIEEALGDQRPWLMGEQFTLADLCYAPFVARIAGLQILEVWLSDRPLSRAWWRRLSEHPSFVIAEVGPSADERESYAREGGKIAAGVAEQLQLIRAGKGLELAVSSLFGNAGTAYPAAAIPAGAT
jgi:glutathione S-transferase